MRIKRQTIELTIAIFILMGISMAGTFVPQLFAPKNRIFVGIHGYSPDFVGYVSYIKEGEFGHYSMSFRSYPVTLPATPIHIGYVLAGALFGPLGLEAPEIYHLLRIILGILLLLLMYQLFTILFKRHTLALLTTFVACVCANAGWYTWSQGAWKLVTLNFFPFYISTPQRLVDRPHYLAGGVLFLWIFNSLLTRKYNYLFYGVLAFMLFMVHVSSGMVLAILSGVIFILPIIQRTSQRTYDMSIAAAIAAGSAIAAGATYYFIGQISRVTDIYFDKYIYSMPNTLESFIKQCISFGPMFWIGVPGLLTILVIQKHARTRQNFLMLGWIGVQFSLFFFLFPILHVDPVRFLQSLYYIPIAYATIFTVRTLSHAFGKWIFPVSMTLILVCTVPVYLTSAYAEVFAMTDFTEFAPFPFPSKNQYLAYKYLDAHTPKESVILGDYEAANLLLLFSHNRVIGNDQGWSPEGGQTMRLEEASFYQGVLDESEAKTYLEKNHIEYVYDGFRERGYGGDITKYPFLTAVYQNPEVTIYKVMQ